VGTAPEAHQTGPTWLYEERFSLTAIFQPQFSTVNKIFISSHEWENGVGVSFDTLCPTQPSPPYVCDSFSNKARQ
jgi:hypothetical protein